MRALRPDRRDRGSIESAVTRDQLAGSVPNYEQHEYSIIEAFEAHDITEIALWRGAASDWADDCFEERLSVLQGLLDDQLERALLIERELQRQVEASQQRRDLRRLAARLEALHGLLPALSRPSEAGDSAA